MKNNFILLGKHEFILKGLLCLKKNIYFFTDSIAKRSVNILSLLSAFQNNKSGEGKIEKNICIKKEGEREKGREKWRESERWRERERWRYP